MVMKDNKSNMLNPRADSFSLYMNFVADMLLKGVLPKNKIAKNSIHKVLAKIKNEFTHKTNTQFRVEISKNMQNIIKKIKLS